MSSSMILGAEEQQQEQEEHLFELTEAQKKRVYALEQNQKAINKVTAEMNAEIHMLHCRYEQAARKFAEMRLSVLRGTLEPTEKDLEGFEEPKVCSVEEEEVNGIPHFWLYAMQQCPPIAEGLCWTDDDKKLMEYLEDISVETHPYVNENSESNFKKGGFNITFHFRENPFIKNKSLDKKYIVYSTLDDSTEDELDSIISSPIEWKEGQDYTENGKKDTFLNFFKTYNLTETSDDSTPENGADGNEDDEKQEDAETDFEIGRCFKEKFIPNATNYFRGLINEDDDDGFFVPSSFMDMLDDNDEDDDDEEDDE